MTPETFQSLNRYFDKVYVLSLPRAKARQDNIVEVLEGLEVAPSEMPHALYSALQQRYDLG